MVERGEKHYLKSELPSGEINKSVFTATLECEGSATSNWEWKLKRKRDRSVSCERRGN